MTFLSCKVTDRRLLTRTSVVEVGAATNDASLEILHADFALSVW